MPWLFYVILILFVLYILNLVLVLILENRDPYKTITWLLVLILLPGFGLIAYLFLGESLKRKFYDWKVKRKKYNKAIKKIVEMQKNILLTKHYPKDLVATKNIVYLALQSTNMPFSNNNEIKFLNDGKEFFPELFTAIKSAKKHIHLEYYIFEDDSLSKDLFDLLIKKSKENVKIRILVDGLGASKFEKNFKKTCRLNNIEYAIFNPVYYSILRSKINHRNHRKIAIIDGRIGFIGGINIGENYLKGNFLGSWRDMQLKIIGPAVYSLQTIFLKDWVYVKKQEITTYDLFPKFYYAGNTTMFIAPSGPDNKLTNLKFILFSLITSAEKRLYIQTPYFIPDEPLLFALKSAALKGVDVKLILPLKSDVGVVNLASKTFLYELLEVGIKIYYYHEGFLHNKLLISDNLCSLGSANLNSRSLNLDFEASSFILDANKTNELVDIFNKDLEKSSIVDFKSLKKTNKFERLKQSLARLISPLL